MKTLLSVAVLLILVVFLAPSMLAQNATSSIIKPDELGTNYSNWSAAWWQWAESVPASTHPLLDRGDCSVGQTGSVWYLGGKFCANDDLNCGVTNIVRTCTIPKGKYLYIAVVNAENTTLEDPSKTQIQELRKGNADGIDSTFNTFFAIDGFMVPRLKQRFRVQSPAFSFTLPADNLFKAIYPQERAADFVAGTYFPDVDDGVYVMLSPLPAGQHVIHFGGMFPPSWGFDVTYILSVQ